MITEMTTYLSEQQKLIEEHLERLIARLEGPERLRASMIYSLQAGGKRLRPILLLAVIDALGKNCEWGLDAACSLEMLHTYSLIHDDLPAMDNDDLRRGKPTNHIEFDEATAILAGDALLTYSFECLARASALSSETKIKLIQMLAKAAGPEGMVGGQMNDLQAEGQQITLSELESVHRRKTGRLLTYAIVAGAVIGEATCQQLAALEAFSDHLGMAFQIKDDILDVEGDEALLGKPVGSDETNQKSTYPGLLTLEGAKEAMQTHYLSALSFLEKAHVNGTRLEALTRYIIERTV
ncbi:polyprenyl synthetase family protein [Pullulanibacillus sp. KACC 23026]|uniref:polyprenyl synthetase family protein n=1 Tax=Pullulanibacillus sp. KACC 23026 TaxID=3028315 RepID=UPI0023B10B45|nr:farnesyl diphosphate synthase [Pullulanibacillus sp. KACC 23026]WEG14321.1 polyprenyl synthetase family protein [Pullulanibacillus sp. KACC 23026]